MRGGSETMMSYVIGGMIIISIISAMFTGNMEQVSNGAMSGCIKAVELVISLAGTIAFWNGIMHVAEQSGITRSLAKLFAPVTRGILFPNLKKGSPALEAISSNIAANLLGLGNAATPLGITAMQELEKEANYPEVATDDMITFVAINTASLQIIPTTTAFLRLQAGSQNPLEIIVPVWISSVMALIVAVTLSKVLSKRKRYRVLHSRCGYSRG